MPIPAHKLGKCNNSGCLCGCGLFFSKEPQDTDSDGNVAHAGVPCGACGCFAGQHIIPETPVSAPTAPATAAPTAPTPAPAPAPVPAPPKAASATESTLKGSRPASGLFRNLADMRKDNIQASLPAGTQFHPAKQSQVEGDLRPYKSKSRKKKGKSSTTSEPADAAKPARVTVPAVKKRPGTVYTVLLVEATKDVARGLYVKPDAHKLNDLADDGYMQKVSIPSDTTSAEIIASVEREFNEHHITHVVDHGFRLLRVRPILKKSGVVKKGKAPLLRPLKGVSEVNLVNWERCLANTNVRNAGKGFKNLIFIALNPAGPNLPFGGVTEFSDDSLDEDLESAHGSDSDAGDPEAAATGSKAKRGRVSDSGSDSNNDSDNHTAKKSKKEPSRGKAQGKANPDKDIHMASDEDRKKAKAEKPEKSNAEKQGKAKAKAVPVDDSDSDDSSDTGDKGKGKAILTDNDGSDDATGDGGKEPDNELSDSFRFHDDKDAGIAPVSSEHLQLHRLLKNMSKPKSGFGWTDTVPERYRSLGALYIAEWMRLTVDGTMTVRTFYGFFRTRFLLYINDLLEAGDNLPRPPTETGSDDHEDEFDSLFSLGAGGLDLLMRIFDDIYKGIRLTYHLVNFNEFALAAIADVHSASRSLLLSLQHFRAKHPRFMWDPKGCRELSEFCTSESSKFPIGLVDNRMITGLKLINVHKDSEESLVFLLASALGDARDSKRMNKDILITGPDGLPFFYEHVVARVLDDVVEREEYDYILELICATCTAIMRKITSDLKSRHSSRPRSATPNTAGPNPAPEGRRTRNGGAGACSGTSKRNATTGTSQSKSDSESDSDSVDEPPRTSKQQGKKRTRPPSPIVFVSSDDEAPPKRGPRTSSARTRIRRRTKGAKKSVPVDITSESEAAPPEKGSDSKPKEPKSKSPPATKAKPPPATKPGPSKPDAPPTAGPSGSRPKPRPKAKDPNFRFEDFFTHEFFTRRTAPSASASASNPRPAPGVARDVWDVEAMHYLNFNDLIQEVLRRFPHPIAANRVTYQDLVALTPRGRYLRLVRIYHPDHNGTQSAEWQRVATAITQRLNVRKPQ
ncbi:hypothetical protein B0H10DRAFT_2127340 [Mycena sp. CBHHK59/15]|nr:hypothetical protein B0H10DRAFT_2127340 [Mycena sp. CBHHK59/15]